jgi:hypothetical protein
MLAAIKKYVLEKIYLADRQVVLIIGFYLCVAGRCKAGKMLEIIYKMRLIVEPAIL